MTTNSVSLPSDEDTQQVSRAADADTRPPASGRLAEMDLDPPSGPVPADVLAYFEQALARENIRRAA